LTSSRTNPANPAFDPSSGPGVPPSEGAVLERQTMRKISVRLLPLLFVLYVAAQLDRTNVAIAALQMNRAIGLSAAAYGLGAGIFFLGYSLFEVPSNLILVRVGARWWISRIAITWGIASCGMLLARGPTSFYALRFLLGVAEAGYFPGIIFYLRRWFPERHRARAVSRFMIGIPIAAIVGGPVGGLLLGLDGRLGLTGWQWLFLIEGLPAVVFGIVALVMLTERPADATWLSREEKAWLENELAGEASRSALAERGVLETLKSPTVWLLAMAYFVALLAMLGVNFWAPTVVKELLHLTNQQVGVVTGVIGLVGLAGMLTNGWHSDRTGERLVHAAIPVLLAMSGLILAGASREPMLVVGGLALVTVCHSTIMPAFWCLPSLFLRGAGVAAGIALISSVGTFGGFIGPNVVGRLKQATGNYSMAFYTLALLALVSAMLIAWLGSKRVLGRPHRNSVAP
jgi:ACS family tartrate transporter-like MFS transporter